MTSGKSRWTTMWEFLFAPKPADLAPKSAVRAVKTDLTKLDRQTDRFVWFGHSSYLLINGGSTFLVDPVLTSRYPTSLMMKPFKGSDIYTPDDIPPVDYLIITHDHYDHLDYATVKALKERIGRVICPLGVGEHFEYWGYTPESIIELDWDESVALPTGQLVTCLPARHFFRTLPQTEPDTLGIVHAPRQHNRIYRRRQRIRPAFRRDRPAVPPHRRSNDRRRPV